MKMIVAVSMELGYQRMSNCYPNSKIRVTKINAQNLSIKSLSNGSMSNLGTSKMIPKMEKLEESVSEKSGVGFYQ